MKYILTPTEIAEKCTLREAVEWIAFSDYPAAFFSENGMEKREDLDCNNLISLSVDVTSDDVSEYLETAKAELLVSLRKKLIKSYGRFITNKEETNIPLHRPISDTSWISMNINWDESTLETKQGIYIHVLIDTESLFSYFPQEEPEAEIKVYLINGKLLMKESEDVVNKLRIGRPSFKWKDFTAEMIARRDIGLPKLQKTCIYEMTEWCKDNWGKIPSQTNLQEHVSPFYKKQKIHNYNK